MTPHLNRRAFVDRDWDAGDLDLAAEFWMSLYDEAAVANGYSETAEHETEIRLRGFPRHAGEAVLRELAERADDGDFPEGEIDRPDPDTLSISSGAIRVNERPPHGLGLPMLFGEPFDGLMVEFRFRVIGRTAKHLRQQPVESTLVIVGEIRGESVWVKALWRVGASGWEESLAWLADWTDQERWLAALDDFRERDEVPRDFAKKLFPDAGTDRAGGRIVKLLHVPLNRPRFGGLFVRAAGFSFALAALAAAASFAAAQNEWLLAAAAVVVGLPVLLLAGLFYRAESQLWFAGYRRFRATYAELYAEPVRNIAMSRAEADARNDHPYLTKYTADLEAAGFRVLGDHRLAPERLGTSLFRTFAAPDNTSYLTVLFHLSGAESQEPRFQSWPAAVNFLAHTFFTDGGHATSVNGRIVGFRKKRTGPEHVLRVFPDADDAVEFARLHSAAAQRFGEASGRQPLPHRSYEQFLQRLAFLHDEEQRLFADRPYSWGDHLGWYLQRVRAEYLR